PPLSPLFPYTTLFRSVMGLYDMTLLEEPPYSDACWETDKACAFKPAEVLIGAHKPFVDQHPEIAEFLNNYETTLAQNNDVLAYIDRKSTRLNSSHVKI